jgi:hypothetical protein
MTNLVWFVLLGVGGARGTRAFISRFLTYNGLHISYTLQLGVPPNLLPRKLVTNIAGGSVVVVVICCVIVLA